MQSPFLFVEFLFQFPFFFYSLFPNPQSHRASRGKTGRKCFVTSSEIPTNTVDTYPCGLYVQIPDLPIARKPDLINQTRIRTADLSNWAESWRQKNLEKTYANEPPMRHEKHTHTQKKVAVLRGMETPAAEEIWVASRKWWWKGHQRALHGTSSDRSRLCRRYAVNSR